MATSCKSNAPKKSTHPSPKSTSGEGGHLTRRPYRLSITYDEFKSLTFAANHYECAQVLHGYICERLAEEGDVELQWIGEKEFRFAEHEAWDVLDSIEGETGDRFGEIPLITWNGKLYDQLLQEVI